MHVGSHIHMNTLSTCRSMSMTWVMYQLRLPIKKPLSLQEKMQFLTYISLTYDYICQHCVFKLAIMTYTTNFKAIMTYIQLVVLFHDLG